jgi:spermidine/putrescine transport system permease protein
VPASSGPLSVKICNFHGSPTPAVNAAATFLLVTTTAAIVLGYVLYRRATRGQRTAGVFEFANV